jgi:hypothetical protein
MATARHPRMIVGLSSTRRSQIQLKPWHLFAATGVAVLLLVYGLHAEHAQPDPEPGPLVPYTLVVVPVLFVSGIVLAIRRRHTTA